MTTKRCTKCKQEYPATKEFLVVKSSRPDGLDSWCRICKREYATKKYYEDHEHALEIARRYRERHPEITKERNRKWQEENPDKLRESKLKHRDANIDQIRASQRGRNRKVMQDPEKHAKKLESDHRYREKNLEKDRQHSRDYRKKNPHIVKASIQKWCAENPERTKLLKQRRLARKGGLPDTLTIEEWKYAISYWNGCCAYCFEEVESLTLDHYIPLSNPDCPGTVAQNIIPACRSCNSSKNNGDVMYWLSWRFGEKEARVILANIIEYFDSLNISD